MTKFLIYRSNKKFIFSEQKLNKKKLSLNFDTSEWEHKKIFYKLQKIIQRNYGNKSNVIESN